MEMVFERGSNSYRPSNYKGNNYSKNKKKKNPKRVFVTRALIGIQLVIAAVLNAKLMELDLLPKKYDVLLIVAIVLINVITWFSAKKLNLAVLMSLTSVLISTFLIAGTLSIFKIDSTIGSVLSDTNYEIVHMAVVVPVDSEINNLSGLKDKSVAFIQDDEHTNAIKSQLEKELSEKPEYDDCTDVVSMTKDLLNEKIDSMIVNPAHLDMVKEIEEYMDLDDRIKTIHTFELKIEKQNQSQKKVDKDTFIVYLSGSDSRQGTLVASRSDVNILAVVNKKERTVHLINTPRDYYVEIAGCNGAKDKLTHAGVKGIKTSIATLEDLYDIEIDYYFKINFSGFTSIIDKVGGIDVYSDQSFKAITGDCYSKGMNHLNGKEALAFARERYALKGGDDQRGQNQMAVIKATSDKLMSKEILKNYEDILKCLTGCVDMDIPSDEIYGIVKNQLQDNKKWEITSTSVTGTGLKTTTYMSSTEIWVTEPNMEEVINTRRMIKDCLK